MTALAVVAATDRPQNSAAVVPGDPTPVTTTASTPITAPLTQDETATSARLGGSTTTIGGLLTTPPTICALAGTDVSQIMPASNKAKKREGRMAVPGLRDVVAPTIAASRLRGRKIAGAGSDL